MNEDLLKLTIMYPVKGADGKRVCICDISKEEQLFFFEIELEPTTPTISLFYALKGGHIPYIPKPTECVNKDNANSNMLKEFGLNEDLRDTILCLAYIPDTFNELLTEDGIKTLLSHKFKNPFKGLLGD
ncbi:MAG TPA: hypothetical protein PKD00_03260 [Burkholderiales bacterium]|nr:hypothetical protein [Burkholderiales bacterium]